MGDLVNQMKISIVVPVFNAEKYLPECLDSILNQEYKNLEIICVDDGSTDKSSEILDLYVTIDDRIKVIHKKNTGVSDSRNVGLKKATGDFIGFVDADDFVEAGMFGCLQELLQRHNADIAICAFTNGKNYNDDSEIILDQKQAIIELDKGDLYMGHLHNKLFRRDVWENTWLDPEIRIWEDLLVLHYVFARASKVIYTSKGLYNYRIDDNSALRKGFSESYLTVLKSGEYILDFYRKNMPDMISYGMLTYSTSRYYVINKIVDSGVRKQYSELTSDLTKEYRNSFNRRLYKCKSTEANIYRRALSINLYLYLFVKKSISFLRIIKRKLGIHR